MNTRYFLTAFITQLTLIVLLSGVAGAEEKLPCLQCHKSKNAFKTVHAAIDMGCDVCHGTPHKEEKPELSLTVEAPDLCYQCHDTSGFQKTSVHTAVAAGMCTGCHNPHSNDNPKLLIAAGGDLCFNCHDNGMFTKAVQHSPVAGGECTTCHNPHSSDNAKNLEAPPAELCTMCHGDEAGEGHVLTGLGLGDKHPLVGKPDPSQEGKELSCISCHTPHSSDHASLFKHDSAKAENLCMKCHRKTYIKQ